jgi:hypothetical protein
MIEAHNPPFCKTAVIGCLSFFNSDNIELMKNFADKEFDLAIVDPPYGLGKRTTDGGGTNSQIKFMNDIRRTNWDDKTPDKEYWEQLFRVSKKNIVTIIRVRERKRVCLLNGCGCLPLTTIYINLFYSHFVVTI